MPSPTRRPEKPLPARLIALVEFLARQSDPVTFARRTATRIVIAHLERIPLRTSYPDVVERIRTLVEDSTRQKRRLEILMDSTGVGAAVRDMLKAAGLGVPVTGVVDLQRLMVAERIGTRIPFEVLRQGRLERLDLTPDELTTKEDRR